MTLIPLFNKKGGAGLFFAIVEKQVLNKKWRFKVYKCG